MPFLTLLVGNSRLVYSFPLCSPRQLHMRLADVHRGLNLGSAQRALWAGRGEEGEGKIREGANR